MRISDWSSDVWSSDLDHRRTYGGDEEYGDRLQHRPLRQRDPDRGARQLQVDRSEAAGRPGRISGRQADHHPVEGPPGEPRQRDGPPIVRDVGELYQPAARADRTVDAKRAV